MIALHAHERAALKRGSVLLLRPVELGVLHRHRILTDLIAPDQRDGEPFLRVPYRSLGEDWAALLPCPLGLPGDTLTTDAGPVTVVSVRVVRRAELTATDALDAGALKLPNRPTYAAECADAKALGERMPPVGDGPLRRVRRWWCETFPAHPWEQAWCWAVTVERRG